MNAFEQLIADCLSREGYWTLTGVKVKLSKSEKEAIGRNTAPRWELDVLAYRPTDNSLLVIECKSYLNSRGVDPSFFEPESAASSRYKLFTDEKLWAVVKLALVRQLVEARLVQDNPTVTLGLAYGRAVPKKEPDLRLLFQSRKWRLIEPSETVRMLVNLANDGWENSTTSIVSKILQPYLLHEKDPQ